MCCFPAAGSSGAGAAAAAAQQEPTAQQKPLEEMDLDEFLDGGFTAYGGAAAAAGGSSSDEEGQELSSGSGQEDMEEGDSEGLSEDEAALLAGMANGHAKPPSKQTSQQQQKAAKKQPAAAEEQGGDSSSEDEEEEAAAAAAGGKGEDYQAVAADSNRLKGQISKHRQQLEALRTKDPEFYKYLQQTDAQLLGFGEGEEEEEGMEDLSESSDEGSDSEDAQEQPASAAAAKKQKQKQAAAAADSEEEEDEAGSEDEEAAAAAAEPGYNVTSEMLDSWCKAALKNPTPGTVKHLVQAYRAACHYGDSEAGLDTTLRISSSAVFNRVLLFMLREADGLFRRMLGLPLDAATAAPAAAAAGGAGPGPSSTGQQQQQGGKGAKGALLLGPQVSKAPRWRKVEGLVKSYLGNTLHLLGQMTEPAMLAFLLRRLRASAAFLGPFDKIQRKLLKAALQVFGTAEHGPRVQVSLCVWGRGGG
jgi:nucleolar complex protein 2